MSIELLYFVGCPNADPLLQHVREMLSRAGRTDQIHLRRVESADAAERERFLGSPTLRVDGRDVEPGAGVRHDYALACRCYGSAGIPADEWIRAALKLDG